MANYKPIKVMFNIEDSHQLKQYNYIKERSNGSSYIRTLVHQDMARNEEQIPPPIIDYLKDEPKIIETRVAPIIEKSISIFNEDDMDINFDDLI